METEVKTMSDRLREISGLSEEISGNHAFDALGVLLTGLHDEMDFFFTDLSATDMKHGLSQMIDILQEWQRGKLMRISDLVLEIESDK